MTAIELRSDGEFYILPECPEEPNKMRFQYSDFAGSRTYTDNIAYDVALMDYDEALSKSREQAIKVAPEYKSHIEGRIYIYYDSKVCGSTADHEPEFKIKENTIYRIDCEYEVRSECVECGVSENQNCKGYQHCIFDSSSQHEGPLYKSLAYIIHPPVEREQCCIQCGRYIIEARHTGPNVKHKFCSTKCAELYHTVEKEPEEDFKDSTIDDPIWKIVSNAFHTYTHKGAIKWLQQQGFTITRNKGSN